MKHKFVQSLFIAGLMSIPALSQTMLLKVINTSTDVKNLDFLDFPASSTVTTSCSGYHCYSTEQYNPPMSLETDVRQVYAQVILDANSSKPRKLILWCQNLGRQCYDLGAGTTYNAELVKGKGIVWVYVPQGQGKKPRKVKYRSLGMWTNPESPFGH